jgi:plastocyanin
MAARSEAGRAQGGHGGPPLRVLLFLALLVATSAGAEELRGKVQLLARGGKGAAKGTDVRQAVVYYEPASGAQPRSSDAVFEMSTHNKQFEPRLLVVPRGSRIRFPNQDPILHNAFSVSGGNRFDLGLYRTGPGKEKRFDHPGLIRVFCNVHHDMVAYILVLETPYYVSPNADGEFVLSGLPKGRGKLTVWHEQAEAWSTDVELPRAAPLTAPVEIVRPLVPPHLNKTGQSYFRSDRSRYGGP